MSIKAYLNVNNIDSMLAQPARSFSWIGFDSIDNCNLHCVYCHNPRTKQSIDLSKFDEFIRHRVVRVENFQIGCQMEPSLDKRLVTLLEMIADSPAKPTRQFKVHTNGTLLNRHDHLSMVKAGLTHLSISIDTANEKTFAELRGGAKLERIFRNVKTFCDTCPEVTVQFIATVTSANVDEMDLLVERGVEIGAKRFHFREMFHDPRSNIVNHDKMEKLVLPPGRFHELKTQIEHNYANQVGLFFVDSPAIRQYGKETRDHSR